MRLQFRRLTLTGTLAVALLGATAPAFALAPASRHTAS